LLDYPGMWRACTVRSARSHRPPIDDAELLAVHREIVARNA
jgi:hypothetical protein